MINRDDFSHLLGKQPLMSANAYSLQEYRREQEVWPQILQVMHTLYSRALKMLDERKAALDAPQ